MCRNFNLLRRHRVTVGNFFKTSQLFMPLTNDQNGAENVAKNLYHFW